MAFQGLIEFLHLRFQSWMRGFAILLPLNCFRVSENKFPLQPLHIALQSLEFFRINTLFSWLMQLHLEKFIVNGNLDCIAFHWPHLSLEIAIVTLESFVFCLKLLKVEVDLAFVSRASVECFFKNFYFVFLVFHLLHALEFDLLAKRYKLVNSCLVVFLHLVDLLSE